MSSKQLLTIAGLMLLSAILVSDRTCRQIAAADAAAAGGTNKTESTALQYARMLLKLAEVNMQYANRQNQRVSGTVPPAVMDDLQDDLLEAKARVQALEGSSDQAQAALKGLEASSQAAKRRYQRAREANDISNGAVPEGQLERLKVLADLADLRIKRAQELSNAPHADQIQWQIDLLREDVNAEQTASALFRDRD